MSWTSGITVSPARYRSRLLPASAGNLDEVLGGSDTLQFAPAFISEHDHIDSLMNAVSVAIQSLA